MTNYLVLDTTIEYQQDSSPIGFTPVALIRLPYDWLSMNQDFRHMATEIAETIVEQNCLTEQLPCDYESDENPYDRYVVIPVSQCSYDAYRPYVPLLEQTMPSWLIYEQDEPVAYYGGDNGNMQQQIEIAQELDWLDPGQTYTYKECRLTKLEFGDEALVKIH